MASTALLSRRANIQGFAADSTRLTDAARATFIASLSGAEFTGPAHHLAVPIETDDEKFHFHGGASGSFGQDVGVFPGLAHWSGGDVLRLSIGSERLGLRLSFRQ